MNELQADCIVIGAGISGLACANRLVEQGKRVLLVEASSGIGGLLSSYRIGSYSIERYYHHFFAYDLSLLRLFDSCGLTDEIDWKKASTGYYYKGEVYNLDTPREIFLYRHLGLYDKIRLSIAVLNIKRMKDFRHLDRVTAREWLLKNTTASVYHNFFEPLLKSKFGSAADQISAAWLCARLKLRSNRKVSGEKLGYPRHGFDGLLGRLWANIERSGEVLTSSPVRRILHDQHGVRGVETDAGTLAAKTIVATLPPSQLMTMADFPDEYRRRLDHNTCQSAVCVLFGMKRPLLDTYWLNIRSETLPFALLIEHTNFHDIPDYHGEKLLYAAAYHDGPEHPGYRQSEGDIVESYITGLEKEFGLDRTNILWHKLSRDPAVGPIYTIHFLDHLLSNITPVPGLFLGGMMTSYPERGISVSIDQGEQCADRVIEFLGRL